MRARPWLLIFAIACDRGHHEAPAPTPTPPPAAPQGACSLAPIPLTVPVPHRLVAIGDLHGDLVGTRAALRAAGAIGPAPGAGPNGSMTRGNDPDAWIGGDLVVVQAGDVLDRGDDESAILELLARLDRDARAQGGAVIQLLGNHELMNAAGDYRYVTPGAERDFGGQRALALAPGGPWARKLAQHNTVAIANGNVISHAGVVPGWVNHVDELNLASRCWLDGQAGGPEQPVPALTSDDSPVWTRTYGIEGSVDCAQLAIALERLHAQRMIVAHTVQPHGITSACDGRLWRIDVGLAGLYGGPIQVLELGDSPRVITGSR